VAAIQASSAEIGCCLRTTELLPLRSGFSPFAEAALSAPAVYPMDKILELFVARPQVGAQDPLKLTL